MRAVVIGTDEDGDVLAGRALHQRAAHRRPGGEQALGVGGQRGPDLVPRAGQVPQQDRSEEHTSELQSQSNLVCRLLLEKKKKKKKKTQLNTSSRYTSLSDAEP